MKHERSRLMAARTKSPPARGRGLKLDSLLVSRETLDVAPRAGAWIETMPPKHNFAGKHCRPPRGGVD